MLKENSNNVNYEVYEEDEGIDFYSHEGELLLDAWFEYKKKNRIKGDDINPAVPIGFAIMYANTHHHNFGVVLDIIVYMEVLKYNDSWNEFIKNFKSWLDRN